MTQQELIDRLNQLTLHYNLTWFDIKYDADKAIAKINSFMGAQYPKMSVVLTHPEASYTVRVSQYRNLITDAVCLDSQDGACALVAVDHPIFPEEYMHSVVIPFIAMEILARDEEFTTIYNKYAAELEDGLFNMFQREFNKVPLVFRQQPDQGVFFASDTAQGRVTHNNLKDLPVFKFRVHYHINNDEIVFSAGLKFTEDTRAYLYGDIATVKGWNIDMINYIGTQAYHFKGWARNKNEVMTTLILAGAQLTMMSDVHLYAQWDVINTLAITAAGVVSIKDTYKPSLTYLLVPDRINNIPVTEIKTDFILNTLNGNHANNLMTIILPKYLKHIQAGAFNGFQGTDIVLPETPITLTYPGISIDANAFMSTPNLREITLPLNVHQVAANAFPAVVNKNLIIRCRRLEVPTPDGWASSWYAGSNPAVNYTVEVVWGYNG